MPIVNTEDYDCVVRKDGSSWVAEYPDVPGVSASGDTRLDALSMAEHILALWLKNARELDMTIPEPGEARTASGEFKVRLPRTLHARLARLAESHSLSLNELTTRFLNVAVGRVFLSSAEVTSPLLCDKLPNSEVIPSSSSREFSGSWVQRTPRFLHLHLQRLSEAEGTSLNALVIYLLSCELGNFEGLRSRVRKLEDQQDAA